MRRIRHACATYMPNMCYGCDAHVRRAPRVGYGAFYGYVMGAPYRRPGRATDVCHGWAMNMRRADRRRTAVVPRMRRRCARDVRRMCRGCAMYCAASVPRMCYYRRTSYGAIDDPCACHGCAMGVPWVCHGYAISMGSRPWVHYGFAMEMRCPPCIRRTIAINVPYGATYGYAAGALLYGYTTGMLWSAVGMRPQLVRQPPALLRPPLRPIHGPFGGKRTRM